MPRCLPFRNSPTHSQGCKGQEDHSNSRAALVVCLVLLDRPVPAASRGVMAKCGAPGCHSVQCGIASAAFAAQTMKSSSTAIKAIPVLGIEAIKKPLDVLLRSYDALDKVVLPASPGLHLQVALKVPAWWSLNFDFVLQPWMSK